MSRVINPNPPGKERKRLTRAVALALRELAQESEPSTKARDLIAFIVLSLESIADSIEDTVIPWEKRGYWIKADRFRMEWAWTGQYSREMRVAFTSGDWAEVAQIAGRIGQKLGDVKISNRHRMGKPWVGASQHMGEGDR